MTRLAKAFAEVDNAKCEVNPKIFNFNLSF